MWETKRYKKQQKLVYYFALLKVNFKHKKIILKTLKKVLTIQKLHSIIQNVPTKQGTQKSTLKSKQ